MDSTLIAVIPGVIAGILSILTLMRTQKTEDRSAARDTVEMLESQNKALQNEVADLRRRMTDIEIQHHGLELQHHELETQHRECEKELAVLRKRLADAGEVI